jgi:GNAT superfamily N-acetyltransferase
MSFVIRAGVETDAAALAELAARTFRPTLPPTIGPRTWRSWLGVWERNPRANAFYRKVGFTDVGSHVFMVGTDPQTDRIMVRHLPRAIANGAA